MDKEFKNIDGLEVRRSKEFPNYGVTCDGIPYRWDTERRMTPFLHGGKADGTDPYLAFKTSHQNKVGKAYLHKVVAECWVINDDPKNKTEVNHKDGNKRNPHYLNLEWVTPSQNQQHALSTGLKQIGDELYNASLIDDQVHLICQRMIDGARDPELSEMFGTSKDVIRKIRTGDSYYHIRVLYDVPVKYKNTLSEKSVRWVCERILDGVSDVNIVKMSTNYNINKYEVKRIRNKTRYRQISDEYF